MVVDGALPEPKPGSDAGVAEYRTVAGGCSDRGLEHHLFLGSGDLEGSSHLEDSLYYYDGY